MGFRTDEQMSSGGRVLRHLLDEKGKTAKDLAEQLSVTPAAVSKYMGGGLFPSPEMIDGMIGFLELSEREADRLRRSFRDRDHLSSRPRSTERGIPRRFSLMRVGDVILHSVFDRIRILCRWHLEEQPDASVRCDALIRNREDPKRSVGLVFLFQRYFDPDECARIARALQVFYEDEGLAGVLFYRPCLSEAEFNSRQEELVLEPPSVAKDWEIVYDWNLVPAIASRIQPTPEAEHFIRQSHGLIRASFEPALSSPPRANANKKSES